MKLLVVLINYKTADLTERAIESVLHELDSIPNSRVALIDNDSQDGSAEELAQAIEQRDWKDRVTLTVSPRNGGFSYGVNAGALPALRSDDPPDYIYLLNSDARPDPGALVKLVDFMDAHPEVGINGSQLYGDDGALHETAFRMISLAGEFLGTSRGVPGLSWLLDRYRVAMDVPTEPAKVGWLAGASMLIRREVFETIGPFDENFFLYYEETDFCRRAALAGFPTWYIPQSRVEHIGCVSTGWKDLSRPRPAYWFDGRRYYFLKNYGRAYLWAANVTWILGLLIGRAKAAIKGDVYAQPPNFLRDFIRHSLSFRALPKPAPERESL